MLRINQEEVKGDRDRERQQEVTTDTETASPTYDHKLVPSFQHSVLNMQDKSQSLSCRLQTVNQAHPASPCLALPRPASSCLALPHPATWSLAGCRWGG